MCGVMVYSAQLWRVMDSRSAIPISNINSIALRRYLRSQLVMISAANICNSMLLFILSNSTLFECIEIESNWFLVLSRRATACLPRTPSTKPPSPVPPPRKAHKHAFICKCPELTLTQIFQCIASGWWCLLSKGKHAHALGCPHFTKEPTQTLIRSPNAL